MPAHLVLVHGGWGTPGDWDLVVAEWGSLGLASTCVDLPSVQAASAGLADDIAEVGRVLDGIDGECVLVGHSYGGMVITGASVGRTLRRLVYVAAFVPQEDDTAFALLTSVPSPQREQVVQLKEDGTSTVEPWPLPDSVERFGAAATQEMAARPRRPQSMISAVEAMSAIGWREHATTYVLATRDQVIPPALQRTMADRFDDVVELDTDHFPMFEQPAELARILAAVAGASPPGGGPS